MISKTPSRAPPILDFSPFYGTDENAKAELVQQVKDACLDKGFFQIINHGISDDLREEMFAQTEALFDLKLEEKLAALKDHTPWNRGFDLHGTQIYEEGTLPEIKESFYYGQDFPLDSPEVKAGRFNCGPNIYPESLGDNFRSTSNQYYESVYKLAQDVLTVLALGLGVGSDFFKDFATDALGTIRLLHYPQTTQGTPDDHLRRGIGAHTDFGALTILMQDQVGGLQVWDREVDQWYDVKPTPGAYVVNLGNLMMRWTNGLYQSNLHRVINKSGKQRYSVPFFLSGNLDCVVGCIPGCEGPDGPQFHPVKVEDYMRKLYAETYGRATDFHSKNGKE